VNCRASNQAKAQITSSTSAFQPTRLPASGVFSFLSRACLVACHESSSALDQNSSYTAPPFLCLCFAAASQGSHGYCHGVHVERLNGTGRKQFALLHLSIFYKTLFIRQVSPCGRQYLCFTAYQTYDLLQSNELAPSLHSFHPSYPFPLGHNLYPLRPVPDRDASCDCSPGVAEGSVKDSI
jgi:hypothetical protein